MSWVTVVAEEVLGSMMMLDGKAIGTRWVRRGKMGWELK